MKAFKDFFKDEDIIYYICGIRAKYAKQRNKKHLVHLLTKDKRLNYHKVDVEEQSDYEREFQNDLSKLFPCRKKWKNIGDKSRYKKDSKQKLSSIDKNIYSLLKTIKFYRRYFPAEQFVINLYSFIKDIQTSIESSDYFISTPTIYPKPKDRKNKFELKVGEMNICRPIALFSLKERLILSFTNKYLTQLFDCYFDDCSLAFRAVKVLNEKKLIVNHHSAIQKIIKYKNQHKEIPLWVMEADMKKFYDSVNHKIIIEHFDKLIFRAKENNPELDLSIPERIFHKYLDCYSFNLNALPLNTDNDYWIKHKIVNGEFGWVANELKKLKYYDNIENERIGIPQGGALSGLIANIVLDYADKKVNKDDLLYVRFCDDMILMHPKYKNCWYRKNIYIRALKDLKLVPHPFCNTKNLKKPRKKNAKKYPLLTFSPFWKEKSKGPYKWDEVKNGGFPWIGFVGYEIHFNGFIRVRKSSLEKELKKQHVVVNQIINAIKKNKRVRNGTIAESAIHRLIGMSVGRIDLWNYTEIDNEMCWKNGFQELNDNKYSIMQLKELDRTRNKLYYRLIKDLGKSEDDKKDEDVLGKPPNRQIFSYNKPFSYYYQVAERTKKEKSDFTDCSEQ